MTDLSSKVEDAIKTVIENDIAILMEEISTDLKVSNKETMKATE